MNNDFLEAGQRKYDSIPIPEDLEINLKRTLKKGRKYRKHSPLFKILGGIAAALLIFVLSVNLSPNIAYAMGNIPLLNNLVQFVNLDKGLNNLVRSGKIQQLNVTAQDKGAKFTATAIAADDLELYISYSFQGKGLFISQMKFKTKDGKSELPWNTFDLPANKNYVEVQTDKLVKDFIIEVQVYKDDPLFHVPMAALSQEVLNNLKSKYDKGFITTLSIPISLSSKILKDTSINITEVNKEFKSEIGTFKINKLQISTSKSVLYCQLLSEDYELIAVDNPMLFDDAGNQYSFSNGIGYLQANNTIRIDFNGNLPLTNSLSFKCSGIKYVNKKDKHITIDVKNNIVEPNNLGVKLISIKGTKITLDSSKGIVTFALNASNEKGEKISIKQISEYPDSKEELEFKSLAYKKIILNVAEVSDNTTDGFDINLGN
ncbi:MAG TPA: DUF4179 domain-containing protein [Clostridiaceae bacterium]